MHLPIKYITLKSSSLCVNQTPYIIKVRQFQAFHLERETDRSVWAIDKA